MNPHLILDGESVAEHDGVTFHLNPARKSPANPVLTPGRPEDWDGLRIAWPGTVLYDRAQATFRCWYSGLSAVQAPGRKWNLGYAESTDGLRWQKPALGQVAGRDGSGSNRIREAEQMYLLQTVFQDPEHAAYFTGIWLEYLDVPNFLWRKRIAWSHDGLQWDWEGPIIWDVGRGVHDIAQIVLDPSDPDPEFRVKVYTQAQYWRNAAGLLERPPRYEHAHPFIRAIGFLHGQSVESLHEPDQALALEPCPPIDNELHFGAVTKVGGTYLMLFESDRFDQDPLHGDIRLAVSDDGRRFRRVHDEDVFVPTGERGSWDENLLVTTTSGMTEIGDQVWIFYFGCPGVFRAWPPTYAASPDLRGSLFYPTSMGVASIPLDRYAFAEGAGSVLTLPIPIGEDGLWLNAEGEGVAVRVEGTPWRGRLSEARWRTYYRRVEWESGVPPDGLYQVRVQLGHDTRLYSVAS